jgi:GT2 family glycosyltransferase
VDAELVYRAAREGRRILLSRQATVDAASPATAESVGPAPDYAPREGTLRHHAKGFPPETVACDVVLPFHGHLDYVQEAMQSLLDQEGAKVVIHLVDDASPEDTEPLLRYWGTHRRVRTYRNERRLGQFTSFNNVLPYRETGLMAVQDADDISLPQRIWLAGNALRLADADIFGGRTRRFWDERLPDEAVGREQRRRLPRPDRYRFSQFPARGQEHFLLNPTAVMRASAFEALGGFADFGEVERNRWALDTEFYARARYSGIRFAMSRDVVVRYRCHDGSATQKASTGWGAWSAAECRRRAALFQQGPFDPRVFGALRNHWGLTRRLRGPNVRGQARRNA